MPSGWVFRSRLHSRIVPLPVPNRTTHTDRIRERKNLGVSSFCYFVHRGFDRSRPNVDCLVRIFLHKDQPRTRQFDINPSYHGPNLGLITKGLSSATVHWDWNYDQRRFMSSTIDDLLLKEWKIRTIDRIRDNSVVRLPSLRLRYHTCKWENQFLTRFCKATDFAILILMRWSLFDVSFS